MCCHSQDVRKHGLKLSRESLMASGSLEMAKFGLQVVHCRSPGTSPAVLKLQGVHRMYDG